MNKLILLLPILAMVLVSGCTTMETPPAGDGSQETIQTPTETPTESPETQTPAVNDSVNDTVTDPDNQTVPDEPEEPNTSSLTYTSNNGKCENITVIIAEGDSQKTITLNGIEHTVYLVGVQSPSAAIVEIDSRTKEIAEGSDYNVTATGGILNIYAQNIFYFSKESQSSILELVFGETRLNSGDC